MQVYFLNEKIIVGSKIQTVDRIIMPSSIFRKKNYKKSECLNFNATLGKNNEGCQELSYIATNHKKVHYSPLQWYYSSSTVPCPPCPQSLLSTSKLNKFSFVCPFSKFFFPRKAIT
jgi:hypothetical protein